MPASTVGNGPSNAGTELEVRWPGLGPAQAIVLPSYQWMLARIESADSRLQTMMTFVATVTLAVPTTTHAITAAISFGSLWFLAAIALALVSVGLGIAARGRGGIVVPDPTAVYNTWTQLATAEFHRHALYWSGKHFAQNKASLEAKHRALSWLTWSFFAELTCFFVWIARS